MSTIAWITFGTTVGVLSPWLYLRVKNRPRRGPSTVSSRQNESGRSGTGTTHEYAAVSLWPCLEACPAAWKLQGERFLSGEEPSLPLAGCAQATCDCRYREHDDRRASENRRDNWGRFGGFLPNYGNNERRAGRDRRTKAPNN